MDQIQNGKLRANSTGYARNTMHTRYLQDICLDSPVKLILDAGLLHLQVGPVGGGHHALDALEDVAERGRRRRVVEGPGV